MPTSPRAQALSKELKQARTERGLTVRALADRLGWSHARVSRIENAKQGITVEDVSTLLGYLRLASHDRDRLIKMTRDLNEPAWWEVHKGVNSQLASLIDAEQRALRITYVTPTLVPGLLQTRAYSRAVYEAAGFADQEIDDAVAVRQHRQGIIERSSPTELVTYMDESVLQRPTGSRDTAAEQLRYLTKVNERDNVLIRVLPLTVGVHVGLDGMFSIIAMPNGSSTVHIEAPNAGVLLSEHEDVQPYESMLTKVEESALSAADSMKLLSEYVRYHEGLS
ncbi:Helix-turn-helix domain-containing protein [Actinopolyspora lacussalsi subsp. righensis]|uniref:Helix-turn-helix domain-containing protein n=1 Tax=Actinopolyspora righensis TaxID=995060 RepID=A0A1I7BGF9_9ACTN|nr:helix-turn-helix transcriptional regulator [Actinopolyspora righensis]SFT86264.1 Helix-turn-helix domain-containing protein [Actinopolyspora righensis]